MFPLAQLLLYHECTGMTSYGLVFEGVISSFICMYSTYWGDNQDDVFGVGTCYVLDCLRYKPQWCWEIFSCTYPSRLALELTQPFLQWGSGSSSWVKQPGLGLEHPSPSGAKVKNE